MRKTAVLSFSLAIFLVFLPGAFTGEEAMAITVTNEPHPGVLVPGGTFTLNQPNADPTTLQVYLKSPLPPFDLVLLQETVDYTVVPLGNTYQVTVINLPPGFPVPVTYEFVVSYQTTTPVGYNPQWLLITIACLTVVGGLILRKRVAKQ